MGLRERIFPKRKIVIDYTGPFRLVHEHSEPVFKDPSDIFWTVPDNVAILPIAINFTYLTVVPLGSRYAVATAVRGDQILAFLGRTGTIGNNMTFQLCISHNGNSNQTPDRLTFRNFPMPHNLYLLSGDQIKIRIFLGAGADVVTAVDAYYQSWEYD